MKKTFFFLVLIVFLSLPLIFPFFHQGYFPTHDGEWAVIRLGAMHRALMAGHFPVRWAGNLNFSYGYPLFLFTYPLPYYLGEIFNLLGFGLVGSIKALFALSVILSGLAMFFLGKEIFGRLEGIVAAIFYLCAPFRLVNLYVRGSIGESLAFVLYPLLFLSLVKVKKDSNLWLSLGVLFYAALLLTHNVSALLMTPFLVIFAAFFVGRRAWPVFVLGIGFSFFFLFPALTEKGKIALSQIPLADKSEHFVGLKQLVVSNWGLGWVHLVAFILAIVFWFQERKESIFAFAAVSLGIAVILMLPISLAFWQFMPLFSEIDFPWRLLGPASFFLALSLGHLALKRHSRFLALGLVILAIFVNYKYAKPIGFIDYSDDYYLTNEATTTSHDELMPVWVKEKPIERPASKVEVVFGKGKISNFVFNAKQTYFDVEVEDKLKLRINTIYFPGWQVEVDGEPVEVEYDNPQGVMTFSVPSGRHHVLASFGETFSWFLADFVSLASLLFCGGLLFKKRKKTK